MSDITRNRDKAVWESKNYILRDGEYGFENETGKVKQGDGVTRWNDLTYLDVAPYTLPSFELPPSGGGTGGTGGVNTVNGRTPDSSGNVLVRASDISGTFGDSQIPSSIARDSEVSAAVAAAVAALVNSSPDALNTLAELADALGNDKDFASTVTATLGTKADVTDVANALLLKANASDVTSALASKADSSALATKADTSSLANKADVSALATKADLVNGRVQDAQLPARLSDANLKATFMQPALILSSSAAIPNGTPAGTLIFRRPA